MARKCCWEDVVNGRRSSMRLISSLLDSPRKGEIVIYLIWVIVTSSTVNLLSHIWVYIDQNFQVVSKGALVPLKTIS